MVVCAAHVKHRMGIISPHVMTGTTTVRLVLSILHFALCWEYVVSAMRCIDLVPVLHGFTCVCGACGECCVVSSIVSVICVTLSCVLVCGAGLWLRCV